MIEATDAIERAQHELPKIVPTFMVLQPHVEEISRSHDGQEWVIVFRADNPDTSLGGSYIRYLEKEVRVGAANGELLSVLNPSY